MLSNFSRWPAHMHARTHAHTRAHTHTYTHTHTHTSTHTGTERCTHLIHCLLILGTARQLVDLGARRGTDTTAQTDRQTDKIHTETTLHVIIVSATASPPQGGVGWGGALT